MDFKPRINKLRPYQKEIAIAVLGSVFGGKGLTFSVEIARQGGKNELSAQLELLLLTLHITQNKNLIKCSPTFKPQALISMTRLRDRLNDAGFGGIFSSENRATSSSWGMPVPFSSRRMKRPTSSGIQPISCWRSTKRRTSAGRSTARSYVHNLISTLTLRLTRGPADV